MNDEEWQAENAAAWAAFWETLTAEIAKWPKLEERPTDDPPTMF